MFHHFDGSDVISLFEKSVDKVLKWQEILYGNFEISWLVLAMREIIRLVNHQPRIRTCLIIDEILE